MFPGTGYDSNVYLITGNRPMLVDAGTGDHLRHLVRDLSDFIDVREVDTIVLTHRHYDHVGGAAQLQKACDAKVLMHQFDAAPVIEGSSSGTEARMFRRNMDPVTVSTLEGGEVLDTGEHKLQIIHCPGHTIGGISLFDTEGRNLISGDTVFAGGVGRWDLPTGDRTALVESVKRLAALRPVNLFPGHGPCAQGDAEAYLEEALDYLGE